mgnify:CR=1 FL=1
MKRKTSMLRRRRNPATSNDFDRINNVMDAVQDILAAYESLDNAIVDAENVVNRDFANHGNSKLNEKFRNIVDEIVTDIGLGSDSSIDSGVSELEEMLEKS